MKKQPFMTPMTSTRKKLDDPDDKKRNRSTSYEAKRHMQLTNSNSKKNTSKYLKFKPTESVIQDDYIKKSICKVPSQPLTERSLATNKHNGAFIGMVGTFGKQDLAKPKAQVTQTPQSTNVQKNRSKLLLKLGLVPKGQER